MDIVSLLIQDIKKKKELFGIDDSIIKRELLEYFKKNKSIQEISAYSNENQLKRSSVYKKIIKKIRARLHEIFGVFQIPKDSEEIQREFLKKVKMHSENEEDYKSILSTHLSTKERISSYPIIYKKIFAFTGKPKTILDLGCGLNPLSVHYMNLKQFEYIASDVDVKSLNLVQQYFNLKGINGRTLILDLMNKDDLEKLKSIECDVCFLFKVLEIDKRIAEPVFNAINSKFIIVSFSTLSISGKIMSSSERKWFEKMLSRLKLNYESFRTENEIFYLIRKS